MWCPHTYQKVSSSAGTYGGASTWTMDEGTGQVQYWWKFVWCSYPTHRPEHLSNRGHSWSVRWCSKPLYSIVHGSPTAASQWEPPVPSHPHGRGSSKGPNTNWQGNRNVSHPREGSHLPGGGIWAARCPRGCWIPQEHPETPKPEESNEQINATSTPAPSSPTPKPCHCPSQKNKKIMVRDWGWPRYHQQLDLVLHWEEWKDTWLVKGISVHLPLGCQAPQWHPSQRTSLPASCVLQPAIHSTRKEWLVDHSNLSECVETKGLPPSNWILGHPGCLNGKTRRNGSAGLGSSNVCCTFRNAPQGCCVEQFGSPIDALPLCLRGWFVGSYHAGCGRERSGYSACPYRKCLIKPTSEPEEVACSGKLALMQRTLPLASPGLTISWTNESGPPP